MSSSTLNFPVTVEVEEVDAQTGRAMVDELARTTLGIGVDEFLTRLHEGEFDGNENEGILQLVMMAPFAER